jgi:ferredoxin
MPHIIAEPCIGTKDTACVDVCPVDCIHPTKDDPNYESADQLFIDPDTCIDCGLCVDECPVSAIYQDEDLPKEWDNYVQLNIDYFKESPSPGSEHSSIPIRSNSGIRTPRHGSNTSVAASTHARTVADS